MTVFSHKTELEGICILILLFHFSVYSLFYINNSSISICVINDYKSCTKVRTA